MDGKTEEFEGISVLDTTGLPDSEKPCTKELSVGAAGAIAYFPGLNCGTKRSFSEIVGRFNPFVVNERKEAVPLPIPRFYEDEFHEDKFFRSWPQNRETAREGALRFCSRKVRISRRSGCAIATRRSRDNDECL